MKTEDHRWTSLVSLTTITPGTHPGLKEHMPSVWPALSPACLILFIQGCSPEVIVEPESQTGLGHDGVI